MSEAASFRRRLNARREHDVIEFEHQGLPCIATASRFPDGDLAELFLDAGKVGSAAHVAAKDAAIIVSICLQHGVPASTLLHSLEKLRDGSPAGIVGVALSRFVDARGTA